MLWFLLLLFLVLFIFYSINLCIGVDAMVLFCFAQLLSLRAVPLPCGRPGRCVLCMLALPWSLAAACFGVDSTFVFGILFDVDFETVLSRFLAMFSTRFWNLDSFLNHFWTRFCTRF